MLSPRVSTPFKMTQRGQHPLSGASALVRHLTLFRVRLVSDFNGHNVEFWGKNAQADAKSIGYVLQQSMLTS